MLGGLVALASTPIAEVVALGVPFFGEGVAFFSVAVLLVETREAGVAFFGVGVAFFAVAVFRVETGVAFFGAAVLRVARRPAEVPAASTGDEVAAAVAWFTDSATFTPVPLQVNTKMISWRYVKKIQSSSTCQLLRTTP